MIFTNDKIRKFDFSSKKEWIVTNGIGGFASSTIIGMNTRKYHGLLVAALKNSGDRYMILSRLNESIEIGGKLYTISSNQCNNFIENGYEKQEYFILENLPEFGYEVAGVSVIKKVAMKYGENKIAVTYSIKTSDSSITFKLQPLVNYRKFHDTRNCYSLDYSVKDLSVNVNLNSHGTTLHMLISEGRFEKYDRTYYRNMFYKIEDDRGLDAYEDHFMPGEYVIEIPKNKEVTIEFIASVDESNEFVEKCDALNIINRENTRLEKVCKIADARTLTEKHLAIAADSFIVQRDNRKTVIAGYPWFGDWGRDTFIAFEGLLLKNNRFKDAKEIIISFAKYIKDGLVPNLIDENGGSAYNTVDASLWYIDAIYKYYKYTNDLDLIRQVYPKMLEIIEAYKNGTLYDIKMDKADYLISAGNENTQLTWMDAKVGEKIPTPRYGKPVEINALWYNALKIMELLANHLDDYSFDATLSEIVKVSFKKFYAKKGLYDVIEPKSDKIRPNQIIAISLDYSPIDKEKSKEIFELVQEKLYTKKGLKTLSSEDKEYESRYEGGVYSRDMSYHQGTVWPWLLQFYFIASRKYHGEYERLQDIEELLADDCIGSICEIYDADEPRRPNGAFSQAWSVAMAILNK